MENKISRFINLQGKYLTSLLFVLFFAVGQMWGAYSYDAEKSVPEWTVNFNSWAAADDAATKTEETVHNPRLYWNSTKWDNLGSAQDIAFDGDGFYYMYQPGTARQLPTGDALSALCYVVAKKQADYFKYNATSSTISSPETSINGLSCNSSQKTDVTYEFHMPRAGYVRLLIGTDSNGDPTGTANDSWKNVSLSGATTGTIAVTYHASGSTYDVKTKTGATTFATTTYTSAGKKLRSVEFALNSGTTTMTANPATLSNNSGTARKMYIYAVEVYLESATPATTYTVTYSAGDGSVKEGKSLPTQAAVAAGTIITLASADDLEKEGKEFDGWLCNINSTKYAAGASYTMTAAATTFTAQWKDPAPKYTVTLVPAGGTISDATGWTLNAGNYEKEVSSGTELALPTFTKANRTFKTWRKAGPADVISPITVTADVTLTAVWNATVENVIYSWEGAEGGATEVGGTAAGSNDGYINILSAGYYCFKIEGGTSYDKYVEITLAGEEKVKTGDKIVYWGFYNKSSSANARPKMRDGNTPNAQIFDDSNNLPNLYSGGDPAKREFTVPADINTNKVQITRSQTGSNTWIPKIQIIRPTLVEEANLRTVTFDANGGSAVAAVEVASGSAVAQPANPTKAHCRFNGWKLNSAAYDFSTAVTSNITLVADWIQLYTITYAKGDNDATGDAPTQDELAAGEKFTVAANTFALEGKDFDKWNDGTTDYAPGDEYTVGSANVTLTAQWKAASSKYTVKYMDGETELGTEQVTVNEHPTASGITTAKDFYTFNGWTLSGSDVELDDVTSAVADVTVTLDASYTANYASSVNIEQWVLDNKKDNATFRALLDARHYQYANLNDLDSLTEAKNEGDRNYPYLGQKIKTQGGYIQFLLKAGSELHVKFGNIPAAVNLIVGSADPVAKSASFDYTAGATDELIKLATTSGGTVVFQQIMIDEPIAAVKLPAVVTYDAGAGTFGKTTEKYTGTPLVIGDATPAEDYAFAGWYLGEDQIDATAYEPTKNVTLVAHYAPVEYTVTYAGGEGATGSMAAETAGWGTLYTVKANTFEKTGHVWSGWVATKTEDGSDAGITIEGGTFSMPKFNVTLTATWEDNSKVAKIGDAKYTTLEAALADAANGTIELLRDIDVTAQVEIAAGVTATIDLAGHKIEYTGTSTLPSGVILVHNGASLTINDSSDPDAGSIVAGEKAYAAIALTKAGDDAANPAVLVINGGIFTGYYYAITGHGSRPNTEITINGGVITATAFEDNFGIYHPQDGTLTINGGTITAYGAAIEIRAGELEINGGTFTATAPAFSCNPNGSGTTTVGAAIAIAQHTTKTDIVVTIKGGTFEGEKAINESNPQANDPAPQVDLAVKGGDFTGEVSTDDVDHFISGGTFNAPVANENCATGWVPAPADPITGKYSVTPKDAASLIKAVATAVSQDITGENLTGVFKGAAHINTSSSYKMDAKKYFMVQLVDGQNFQAGDIVKINVSAVNDCNGFSIYSDIESDGDFDAANLIIDTHENSSTAAKVSAGINEVELPNTYLGSNKLYVARCNSCDKYLNAGINQVEVVRIQNPQLAAITIDTRDGVIDEANKTVAVQIPYESDLAALTVVPTIVWNAAAATNSIVVNDGSAWTLGDNTYKLTDKDGDYTVYTITLTRDVLKHTVSYNTHGGTAVASEEVVHGEYLAAAPAAPTKDENVFKFWSETEDGAEVDVTTVQINADKEFHAVWEAEPAGIKLFNGNVLNTTNFISAAATTIEISEVEYPCLVAFNSNRTSLAGAKQGDLVLYNATTDAAKIKFDLYNANGSAKKAYVWLVEEGDAAATQLDEIEIAGETRVKTAYYEFNGTKNRTVYLTSGSKADIKVLQAKVIESGAAIKQFGQAGYSLNLNKGRLATVADVAVPFEGATLTVSSEYSVLNSSNLATKSANSFNVTSPVIMHVERSGGKYYVYQDPENKGTLYNANADIELNATGTWYLSSETASAAASFTLIRFDLPKCEKPTVVDLANVELCAGEPYTELTVSATKSDEGTLHYAWFKEAGETDEAVGTDAASFTPAADGEYYVIVTNTLAGHQDNAATSNTISVAHFASVAITTAPEDVLIHAGLDATLSVVATGKNLTYEWFTCDDELGANPVAFDPAQTASSLNLTAIEAGVKYYKVVVTDECGTTASAVAKVEGFNDIALQDVTGDMTWDFSKDGLADQAAVGTNVVMVNVAGVVNNDDFHSDNIMVTANKQAGTKLQASMIKFHTTVNGLIKVIFSNTGSKTSERYLVVNGQKTASGSKNSTAVTYYGFVPAGDVVLTVVEGDGNMLNFTSVKFIAKAAPDYVRDDSWMAPGELGTFCIPQGAVAVGAEMYEFMGRNPENGKIAFDNVEHMEPGKPYLFRSNSYQIDFYYTDEDEASEPDNSSAMKGSFTNGTISDNLANVYYFNGTALWSCANLSVFNYLANRAYVMMDEVTDLSDPNPAPGRRRVTMGVNDEKVATGMDDVQGDQVQSTKVLIDGQLYILRGEKMFDATGRLVK